MEFSSASLQANFSLPVRLKTSKATNHAASSSTSLSFRGMSQQNCSSYLSCSAFVNVVRPNRFSVFAAETTAMSMDQSQEQMPSSISSEPVTNGEEKDGEKVDEENDKITRLCDKLIGVFLVDQTTPNEWRKLLAFSRQWDTIRPYFYKRCQDRAESNDDPDMKLKLHRLARKLKVVDEDVQRHNELIEAVKDIPQESLVKLVIKRRKDFTKEFFAHLKAVAQSYQDNPTEQEALVKLWHLCDQAVQSYDTVKGDIDAESAGEERRNDLIISPLDLNLSKIDSLARNNFDLSAASVQTNLKAWSAVMPTDMTKEELFDGLKQQYLRAMRQLQTELPKDVRILKHIITLGDREQIFQGLHDAFTPGPEIKGKYSDTLCTTPRKLRKLMKSVVRAYHTGQRKAVISSARDLIHPVFVKRLVVLIRIVEKYFM